MLNKDLFGDDVPADAQGSALAVTWEYPPFSVLNARDGWWQERKRAWLALGIQSELGRGNERLEMSHPATTATIDFYAQKRALEVEMGGRIIDATGEGNSFGARDDNGRAGGERGANGCGE